MATILCIDDEPASLSLFAAILSRAGHEVLTAADADSALDVLRTRTSIDLILSDYRMPGRTGIEFLGLLRGHGLDVPLIMVTGHASIEHAVASVKAGAIDYLTKPVGASQLEFVVEQALEFVRLRRENQRLLQEVQQLRLSRRIIGDSTALNAMMRTIEAVAPLRATVLVHGESGTGKELVARAIHDMSERRGAFVSMNCAALPENLIESTLFGHEKGAFTGAERQTKGAFERADQGTLLLDEISEMRLDLQAKLLRVLQEQEFERVGGVTPVRVDTRIIGTTNRNLSADVDAGRFRQDLYYRLSVVPIRVPPLRERISDVPALALHFVGAAAREMDKEITEISPAALAILQTYSWPGNVRELAHVIQRAVILSPGSVLQPGAIMLNSDEPAGAAPPDGTADNESAFPASGFTVPSLNLQEAERALIQRALAATNQNRTRAAELLGIGVRTLRGKLNAPSS
ncbi:MAG: sigma-54 dependent transcriptional regulator [Gemmatimonadota bacterium]